MINCVSIVIPYNILPNQTISLWMQTRQHGKFAGLREFPGGKLEAHESNIDCAIREVFEETNIKLDPCDLVHYTTQTTHIDKQTISLAVFITNRIELFSKENIFNICSTQNLSDELSTLPANYKIITDLYSFLVG